MFTNKVYLQWRTCPKKSSEILLHMLFDIVFHYNAKAAPGSLLTCQRPQNIPSSASKHQNQSKK